MSDTQRVCRRCGHALERIAIGVYISASSGSEYCPPDGSRLGHKHEPTEPASLNAPAGTEGQDGWVKVEDRLPEFHKQVLVAIVTSHARWVETAMRTIDGWYSPVRNSPLEGVTCWQPMPKPPEAI